MKISIFLTIFFITFPIIFSLNLTKFLKPQKFLLVDAVVNLIDKSYSYQHAKGLSVSTTSLNHKTLIKRDFISNFLQKLKTQIRYRFSDKIMTFTDVPRYHNVVFLYDYDEFRSVLHLNIHK